MGTCTRKGEHVADIPNVLSTTTGSLPCGSDLAIELVPGKLSRSGPCPTPECATCKSAKEMNKACQLGAESDLNGPSLQLQRRCDPDTEGSCTITQHTGR